MEYLRGGRGGGIDAIRATSCIVITAIASRGDRLLTPPTRPPRSSPIIKQTGDCARRITRSEDRPGGPGGLAAGLPVAVLSGLRRVGRVRGPPSETDTGPQGPQGGGLDRPREDLGRIGSGGFMPPDAPDE